MPADIKSVIADQKFQSLAPSDQQAVLAHIDPKFAALSSADQAQVINHISNTVMIGGQAVNLKTGSGASSAATSQAQSTGNAIAPINRTAGILASGSHVVPADSDPTGTIAPSAGASSGLGLLGNLSGKIRTQSTAQTQANAKNAAIAAGTALVPELLPEVAGSGVGATLANIAVKGANAGIGAAGGTVAGQALVGENPLDAQALKETGTNAVIGAGLGAGSKVIEAIPGAVKGAVNVAKDTFGEVKPPVSGPEVPAPVSSPVTVDSPFDDAVIRKSVGGKDLSPSARELLRNNSGPTITAGSSPEVHLLKAVAPTNEMIATEGAKLDGILKNAPPLPEAPATKVTAALDTLKTELPGGSEETLSKAIDKEAERYASVLESRNPLEINATIRELDSRINSFTAPEEALEGPASAKDAALVTIRRTLRDSLNSAYPETQPINKQLSDAIEVRQVLRKKFGNVATDSSAANAQYQSELAKGQAQLSREQVNQQTREAFEQNLQRVRRNKTIAKTVGAVAGGAGLLQAGKTVAGTLIK
jgi:hypothetical protein